MRTVLALFALTFALTGCLEIDLSRINGNQKDKAPAPAPVEAPAP